MPAVASVLPLRLGNSRVLDDYCVVVLELCFVVNDFGNLFDSRYIVGVRYFDSRLSDCRVFDVLSVGIGRYALDSVGRRRERNNSESESQRRSGASQFGDFLVSLFSG